VNTKKTLQFFAMFCLGVALTAITMLVFSPQRVRTIISPSNTGEIASINQVYNVLRNHHYFFEGDSQELIDGAIIGMIDALNDPHSTYFTMTDYENFVGRLGETYYGIGSEVTSINGYTIIVAPFPNSPAEEAGLLPNDTVIEVDGENVVGENLQNVVNKIKGPADSVVTLGIQRGDNSELIKIEVTRGEIAQETVRSEMIIQDGNNIGLVQVTTFGENTRKEFIDAIEALEDEGMDSLIVDLRNNSGGYLTAVVQMLDYLLPEGKVIASVQDRNGNGDEIITTGNTPGKDYPIVTLINGGSASASEIFAAAMKEAAHQEVIGTTSYGKGTVQETLNLDATSMLKLTTQVWLTAGGNWINEVGVEPTIEVEAPYFYSFFQVYLPEGEPLTYDLVSPSVQNAQNILRTLGYDLSRTDGYFDESTTSAVKAFQTNQGLEETGIIDSQTARALTMELRDKIRDSDYDDQLQKAIQLLTE